MYSSGDISLLYCFRGDDPSQDSARSAEAIGSSVSPAVSGGDDPSQDSARNELRRLVLYVLRFRGDDPSQDSARHQQINELLYAVEVSGGTIRVRILQADFAA